MCALLIGVSVTGCALIEAEKNNRGGFLDEIADDHWMKADSKKMRALRAITLEASLARIAMIAPKSASDRSLLARRIGETTKRADIVRRCAFNELQLAGQLSDEPCFFFDSVMVDYENALFDLALIALPIEEARNLISRVSGGIASVSVNPLQLVQALLDIGREAFRYGRVVGAIYRDTLELEVQVWLVSPGSEPDDRITPLKQIYALGNDDILAWRKAIAALRAQGLEPIPQQRFIRQLYGIIAYICGQIVSKEDPSYKECARPDLTAALPVVNLPGAGGFVLSGLGAGGARGGGGSAATEQLKGQVAQQKEQQKALQQQVNELKRKLAEQRPSDEFAPYRATLCITDETGRGPKTQRALKLFKAAINEKRVSSVSDELSPNERIQLDQASKKFTTCGRDTNTPPRNPFEVGLYAFNSADGVKNVVLTALKNARKTKTDIYFPGPNEIFDMDRGVKELRLFFNTPAPLDTPSQELEDGIWARM
jgi:hypothetical protein